MDPDELDAQLAMEEEMRSEQEGRDSWYDDAMIDEQSTFEARSKAPARREAAPSAPPQPEPPAAPRPPPRPPPAKRQRVAGSAAQPAPSATPLPARELVLLPDHAQLATNGEVSGADEPVANCENESSESEGSGTSDEGESGVSGEDEGEVDTSGDECSGVSEEGDDDAQRRTEPSPGPQPQAERQQHTEPPPGALPDGAPEWFKEQETEDRRALLDSYALIGPRRQYATATEAPTNAAQGATVYRRAERPICPNRMLPCFAGWSPYLSDPFEGAQISFARLMAVRCLEGVTYKVDCGGRNTGEYAKTDDGLCTWLCAQIGELLASHRDVHPLLAPLANALRPDACAQTEGLHVRALHMKLPQMKPTDETPMSVVSSAPPDRDGVDFESGGIRTDDNVRWRNQSEAAVLKGAEIDAYFRFEERPWHVRITHTAAVVKTPPAELPPVTLDADDDADDAGAAGDATGADADAEAARRAKARKRDAARCAAVDHVLTTDRLALAALLLPEQWNLRRVVHARRCGSHPDLKRDIWFDPQRLALLCAALSGNDKLERFAEAMRLTANGTFRAKKMPRGPNDFQIVLFACSESTRLWAQDECKMAFNALVRRVCRDIANLTHDSLRLSDLAFTAAKAGLLTDREVKALEVNEDEQERPTDADLAKSGKNNGTPVTGNWWTTGRPKKLMRRCASFDPDRGDYRLKKHWLFEAFAELLLAEEGQLELDVNVSLVCFSDGWLYDADKAVTRHIRPQDACSQNTGYPLPTFCEEQDSLLIKYLSEIHPCRPVLEWKLGVKAKGLSGTQAEPVFLVCTGKGGAGKGIEMELTERAYGDYFIVITSALLTKCKNENVEGPTPTRLSLKNKRAVAVDECGAVDANTMKVFLGGSTMQARDLHQPLQKFKLRFNSIEAYSNFEDNKKDLAKMQQDPGTRRRVRVVKYTSQFTDTDDRTQGLYEVEAIAADLERGAFEEGDDALAGQAASSDTDADAEMGDAADADDADDAEDASVPARESFMTKVKHDQIMELAPALMARMIRMHQAAMAPGGSWPAEPPEVGKWTAEYLARVTTAPVLDTQLRKWYRRCDCVPTRGLKGDDPNCPSNHSLHDQQETSKKCEHYVVVDELYERFADARDADTDTPLLEKIVGREKMVADDGHGNSNASKRKAAFVQALKTVRCFCAYPADDAIVAAGGGRQQQGEDGEGVMQRDKLLLNASKEKVRDKQGRLGKKKVCVIRGLEAVPE